MRDRKIIQKLLHVNKAFMLLLMFMFMVPSISLASNVGEIEYDDNQLTPTEQQAGGSGNGFNWNPFDWDWNSIGEFIGGVIDGIVEGVVNAIDAMINFLTSLGQMLRDLWDSLPDWAQDLIITIGLIVAVVVAVVVLIAVGVVGVVVGVIAIVVAAIAGIVYYVMYGGTDAFNPLHAAAWIFGGALAGGLVAFLAQAGILTTAFTAALNGLRFVGGYIGLGARSAWSFIFTRGLLPAFHAVTNGARALGLWFRMQTVKTILITNLYRFAHGGWLGLGRHIFGIGLKGAGVSVAFDVIMSTISGNWDFKAMGVNAVIGFFGSILGVGLWTRVRQAVRWERIGWLFYGAGIGAGLEIFKQFMMGKGLNWENVGISTLVWSTLIPMNLWVSKTGLTGLAVDLAKKFPGKYITDFYKDVIYWNSPDKHPDNGLKNIWNGAVDTYNNFRFTFSTGFKNWVFRMFRIYIP
ncbi:hypothetical protein [Lederbergia graminis]|uniref:Uncharacterized protein n=1 Tax=Lederbergia graminis TaxID=735518 RepID=A0ABW0LEH1_9BACI|nr:hypothetical protein [Bacillaceae bacterium]